jgi:hypothetical protein
MVASLLIQFARLLTDDGKQRCGRLATLEVLPRVLLLADGLAKRCDVGFAVYWD